MEGFILKINTLVRQIRDGENKDILPDKLICWKMLTALPSIYKQWSLTKANDNKMTVATLQKELSMVAKMYKLKSSSGQSAAFMAKQPQHGKEMRTCYRC